MSLLLRSVSIMLTLIAVFNSCSGVAVDLFEDENHKGYITSLEIGDSCKTLGYGKKLVTSVDTHGGCVILFREPGCQGEQVTIAPGTQHHNDLNQLNFNDAIVSLGPCADD